MDDVTEHSAWLAFIDSAGLPAAASAVKALVAYAREHLPLLPLPIVEIGRETGNEDAAPEAIEISWHQSGRFLVVDVDDEGAAAMSWIIDGESSSARISPATLPDLVSRLSAFAVPA